MSDLSEKDKTFGLHFTVKLPLPIIRWPSFAKIRLVKLNIEIKEFSDLTFDVLPTKTGNVFHVDCQLPGAVDNKGDHVVVTLCDGRHDTIIETAMPYWWIHRQRLFLKKVKKAEPFDGEKCKLSIRRMGGRVAVAAPDVTEGHHERTCAVPDSTKELTHLDRWMLLHSEPGGQIPMVLSGIRPCPFHLLLMMADRFDMDSLNHSGRLRFEGQMTVSSWSQDVINTCRFVEVTVGATNCHRFFWNVADHLCANVSAEGMSEGNGILFFPYPHPNSVKRANTDRVSDRLAVVDRLYQLLYRQSLTMASEKNIAMLFTHEKHPWQRSFHLMESHWPCVTVAKSCTSGNFSLVAGLIDKDVAREMLLSDECGLSGSDVVLFDPFDRRDDHLACSIAWRDYTSEVMCIAMVQTRKDIDHTSFSVTHGIGIRMHASTEDTYTLEPGRMFCKSLVKTVSESRTTWHRTRQLNGEKILRPILSTASALDTIGNATKNATDWHRGWVTTPSSPWEFSRKTQLFLTTRKI